MYGTWFDENAYIEGSLSYGMQSYDSRRNIVVGAISRTAIGDYDGDTWAAHLGGGYRLGFQDLALQPYISLDYYNSHQDGYQERGAGSMNQIIQSSDSEALIGEIGVSLDKHFVLRNGSIDTRLSVGLNHDFDIDDNRVIYGYVGEPGTSFGFDDRNLSRNSQVFGIGASYTTERSRASLDYRYQNNDDFTTKVISARINVWF